MASLEPVPDVPVLRDAEIDDTARLAARYVAEWQTSLRIALDTDVQRAWLESQGLTSMPPRASVRWSAWVRLYRAHVLPLTALREELAAKTESGGVEASLWYLRLLGHLNGFLGAPSDTDLHVGETFYWGRPAMSVEVTGPNWEAAELQRQRAEYALELLRQLLDERERALDAAAAVR